ncbi:MAG: hypothetical protein MUD04_03465 [Cyanobium sp. Prado107]|nr:hypothetical protein [Cyanobium sp. Prado107]
MAPHRPRFARLREDARAAALLRGATAAALLQGAVLVCVASAARAESATVMHGFCFRSPLPLSAPRTVGLDALLVAHPPEATGGEERFSLTAVRFPPEVTDTKAGMTPAELREYVTVTFLAGQRQDGTPVQRQILGRPVQGETFTTPVPAPSLGEVFVLRRSDGDSVVLGFKLRQDWAEQGRQLITAITTSLREGEASCATAGPGQA